MVELSRVLPDPVKNLIDETWQKDRDKLTQLEQTNPAVAGILRELNGLEDKYINPEYRYSIEIFRAIHYQQNPDSSVCGLEIDDTTLVDILWVGSWDVPSLAQQIENGSITVHQLLALEGRDRKADFEQLKTAIGKWKDNHPQSPSSASSSINLF